MTRKHFATGVGLAAVLVAMPGTAATVCVNPRGFGGCVTTIQAGVDRAAPGDTVRVAAGTYYEAVLVPPGKDGLQIAGVGGPRAAVLDSSPYADRGFAGGEVAIVVESPRVRIVGLGFRNGLVGVRISSEGVVVQGALFRGTDLAVQTFAADTLILGNTFFDCPWGINIRAPGAVVRDNLFERGGVGVVSEPATFPNQPRVIGNRMEGVRDPISVQSVVEAEVRANRLRNSGVVYAGGPNPIVEGNVLEDGGGLSVHCGAINLVDGPIDDVPADCSKASAALNRIVDSTSPLVVGAEAPNMAVRGNTLLRTNGLVIEGTDEPEHAIPILIEKNTVRTAGYNAGSAIFAGRPCFEIRSVGGTLSLNTASDCADAGFYVRANQNILNGNKALNSGGTGFMVAGVQVNGDPPAEQTQLIGNTALGNSGQGIAVRVGATATQVLDNVASGNRLDFCDEGTDTIVSANTFGTTGDCVVDH